MVHLGIIPDGNRRWCKQQNINSLYYTNDKYLNYGTENIYIVILIHEVLHILGFGRDEYYNFIIETDSSGVSGVFYNGPNCVKAYKTILENNSYSIDNLLDLVPIENTQSFGSGTHYIHFEEGFDDSDHDNTPLTTIPAEEYDTGSANEDEDVEQGSHSNRKLLIDPAMSSCSMLNIRLANGEWENNVIWDATKQFPSLKTPFSF